MTILQRKKTLRKSPNESATTCNIGTTKRGNDGNIWTVISTASGVRRWAKKTSTKKSKRVIRMESDPTTVWGKNKPLEKFWQELASGKKVVLITKDNSKIFTLPSGASAIKKQYIEFDDDPNIIAVLSSNQSQDAYEVYLYPKAKDKTVEHVIKNYKKFFTKMGAIPLSDQDRRTYNTTTTTEYMKKVMVPY